MELYRLTDRIWVFPYEEERDRPNLSYIRGDRWSLAVDAGHSIDHTQAFYHDLEEAGLPLPPWNRFLEQTRQIIPAINAYGYYSPAAGRFLTTEEAEGAEAAALQEYELLQYNAVFDKKNRSEVFFPLG